MRGHNDRGTSGYRWIAIEEDSSAITQILHINLTM